MSNLATTHETTVIDVSINWLNNRENPKPEDIEFYEEIWTQRLEDPDAKFLRNLGVDRLAQVQYDHDCYAFIKREEWLAWPDEARVHIFEEAKQNWENQNLAEQDALRSRLEKKLAAEREKDPDDRVPEATMETMERNLQELLEVSRLSTHCRLRELQMYGPDYTRPKWP